MKKIFKIFLVLVTYIIYINSSKIFAVSDYVINSYNIDMVVNENNTFDITETINVNFNAAKHGIYRKIPLKNTVVRLDGSKVNKKAQISNINISESYSLYRENGYQVIKIGDSNKTLSGEHSYTIKYTYNVGKDTLNGSDEFYFNLIGNEWDTSIDNIFFNIKMPKYFDATKLGFASGAYGFTDSSHVSYSVEGNTISGSLDNVLNPGQALTIRLTLPDGYFVGAGTNETLYSVWIIIFCFLCVIITYKIWSIYGKDDKVVDTVEFYPPEGYNSAEISFLYKGRATDEGIISLLIYLANKGYLKIEKIESKYDNGYKITKLKEYDGNNECEKMFFDGLFRGKKYSKNSNPSITSSDLRNKFYITFNKIKSKLNSKENKQKIFEILPNKKTSWLILMIVLILLAITVKPFIETGETFRLVALLFVQLAYFCLILAGLYSRINISKIAAIILLAIFTLAIITNAVLPVLLETPIYLVMYIIGIISIVIIMLFIKIMPKRNYYGNEMLGRIRGFKRFLEIAEKEELERLVEKNPEYFYDILPFTYALGVSDKWIKQFEDIAIKAPNWYNYSDTFDLHSFNRFIDLTMRNASRVMKTVERNYNSSSSSNSSFGGGFSGGGFSGGGFGGGGGSSW